jgi:toxin ParE1/3/4
MDWTIVWTEPALSDFESAIQYLAQQSPSAAESLRLKILESVRLLSKFPEIGPIYERDKHGRTREIVCGRYRIFYRLANAQRRIEILAVWHSARREPPLAY